VINTIIKEPKRRVFESSNAFGGRAPPGPVEGARPPSRSRVRGPTSKGNERKEGREKEGEGIASSLFNFWLRACKRICIAS